MHSYIMVIHIGGSSRLNKNRQLVVPEEVIRILGIDVGDDVGFWINEENETIELFRNKEQCNSEQDRPE